MIRPRKLLQELIIALHELFDASPRLRKIWHSNNSQPWRLTSFACTQVSSPSMHHHTQRYHVPYCVLWSRRRRHCPSRLYASEADDRELEACDGEVMTEGFVGSVRLIVDIKDIIV